MTIQFNKRFCSVVVVAAMTTLTACHPGEKGDVQASVKLGTLDGQPPLVLSHRGLPGLYPEETQLAYEKAADAGGDSLETDLHLTKDCQLVARHNPWLGDNTNVVDVAKTNPIVAARKRTQPGVLVDVKNWTGPADGPKQYLTDLIDPKDPKSVLKALVVDGEEHVKNHSGKNAIYGDYYGDWSVSDFTMDELHNWIKGTTYDNRTERPTDQNGKWPVISFKELLAIRAAKSAQYNRVISVYPESKNPYWNNQQGIANGCDAGNTKHPFEDIFVKAIVDAGLNSKDAPIFVQSFDPASLKYMRSIGLKTKVVQLIDGNDVDYKTGNMIFNSNDEYTIIDGRPFSWTVNGNLKYFGDMLTPAGLAEIKTYADAIGPWKPEVMSLSATPWDKKDAQGNPVAPTLADVNTIHPTSLIADAHKAGLAVHTYTFRSEPGRLAGVYNGNPVNEYNAFFNAGIDGVFTDFTNVAVPARAAWLQSIGYTK